MQNDEASNRLALRLAAVLGATTLVAGLALVIGVASSWWALADKKDGLRERGVEVVATVTRFDEGGFRTTDMINLSYEYGGQRVERRIRCAGGTGCWESPPPTMRVWVDPDRPTEFLAENGNTDDSDSPRNSWSVFVFGCVLLLIGGVMVVCLVLDARVKRQRRQAEAGSA